jgi:hypothetical protein
MNVLMMINYVRLERLFTGRKSDRHVNNSTERERVFQIIEKSSAFFNKIFINSVSVIGSIV